MKKVHVCIYVGTGNGIGWRGNSTVHYSLYTFTTFYSNHHAEPELKIKGYSPSMLRISSAAARLMANTFLGKTHCTPSRSYQEGHCRCRSRGQAVCQKVSNVKKYECGWLWSSVILLFSWVWGDRFLGSKAARTWSYPVSSAMSLPAQGNYFGNSSMPYKYILNLLKHIYFVLSHFKTTTN